MAVADRLEHLQRLVRVVERQVVMVEHALDGGQTGEREAFTALVADRAVQLQAPREGVDRLLVVAVDVHLAQAAQQRGLAVAVARRADDLQREPVAAVPVLVEAAVVVVGDSGGRGFPGGLVELPGRGEFDGADQGAALGVEPPDRVGDDPARGLGRVPARRRGP
jgi:hypothetical protein